MVILFAFNPESIKLTAGLLTYSPLTSLPPFREWHQLIIGYWSLQLRVQFRILIGFPFNLKVLDR